jgi:NAD+ kinase
LLQFHCFHEIIDNGNIRKNTLKKIGVLYHPMVVATRTLAGELEGLLRSTGISVWRCSAWDRDTAAGQMDGTDLLLTVGGDGTILRAVQAVIPGKVPITGINLGKLGFLTELDADEATARLPEILDDSRGWTEERAMLRADLAVSGREVRTFHALNDVVMARGEIARLVGIEAAIDSQPLTTWKADGVIVATATGSTGYALAAGGPILDPRSRDFLVVPVAPHLSPGYPLVMPETSAVTLTLHAYHPATLSIDGHINLALPEGDTVTVRLSPHVARFRRIRTREYFYSSLEEKLKGKQGVPGRKS